MDFFFFRNDTTEQVLDEEMKIDVFSTTLRKGTAKLDV